VRQEENKNPRDGILTSTQKAGREKGLEERSVQATDGPIFLTRDYKRTLKTRRWCRGGIYLGETRGIGVGRQQKNGRRTKSEAPKAALLRTEEDERRRSKITMGSYDDKRRE